MIVEASDTISVSTSEDVVKVRQKVRAQAVALGFSLVDQTKIVTAASEIGRNTILHGGGGRMDMDTVRQGGRVGLRLVFTDKGPGIPDIARAMTDGYTTRGGLGLGLSGSKRLSNEFDIKSTPGEGTTVTLIRWK
ncbi:MAG TPA: anti-sigma regulatory factor [Alphaproteobacteria bacterium]|nr:anti-sigma regulatory factor [Alphaproteobacteria bacterium]